MNFFKKMILAVTVVALAVGLMACSSSSSDGSTNLLYDIQPSEIDTKAKTYKNSYLGIEATFPSEWVIYSSEIVGENNGVTGALTAEMISTLLGDEAVGEVIDFMARTNDSYKSVMVTYQPYDFASTLMQEEDFAEQMIESMATTLKEDYGFDDAAAAVVETDFAGDSHYTVKISGSYNGNKVYEQQVYYVTSDVITTITFKTWQTDNLSEIMSYFTKTQ